MSRMTRVSAGAIGGAIGSAVMAVPILAAHTTGVIGTPPPLQITRRILDRVDVPVDRDTEGPATALSHVAFGVGAGLLYGAVMPSTPDLARALTFGIAYATGIYAVSYAGWVPALRLMPSAQDDVPARQIVMLVAHWLFGASLAVATMAASHRTQALDPSGIGCMDAVSERVRYKVRGRS